MKHPNRLKLSLAGTAAVALASLPLGVSPASAARVSEGTTSSIGVVETSSNASQFHLKTQGASTDLVATSNNYRQLGASVVRSFQRIFSIFAGIVDNCANNGVCG